MSHGTAPVRLRELPPIREWDVAWLLASSIVLAGVYGLNTNVAKRGVALLDPPLARTDTRTGEPVAIAGHIGKVHAFDEAPGEFAVNYPDRTDRDHRQLSDAIAVGVLAGLAEE